MSVEARFSLSSGLRGPIICPAGTLARITAHVEDVERRLGLGPDWYRTTINSVPEVVDGDVEQVVALAGERHLRDPHRLRRLLGNPHAEAPYIDMLRREVTAHIACEVVGRHNEWLDTLWGEFLEWSNGVVEGDTEVITPEQASGFWRGLRRLYVPPSMWTRDYTIEQMSHAYEVLRGRESRGARLGWGDIKPLSERQAAEAIILFSQWLDPHDIRLDVPKGCDHLATSDNDEYTWCETCGAVAEDDIHTVLLRDEIEVDDWEDGVTECLRCGHCRRILD